MKQEDLRFIKEQYRLVSNEYSGQTALIQKELERARSETKQLQKDHKIEMLQKDMDLLRLQKDLEIAALKIQLLQASASHSNQV